jgi:ketosteroid isomerase-like protein
MATKPTEITERYFEHIRGQDVAGVVALFAQDASYFMPDGRAFTGAAEIGGWFTKLFASLALTPRVVATVVADTAIAVEIENILPDGTKRNTANFFYINASGLIEQLRVYQRS